jgi:hypothetical protein
MEIFFSKIAPLHSKNRKRGVIFKNYRNNNVVGRLGSSCPLTTHSTRGSQPNGDEDPYAIFENLINFAMTPDG